jgi:hypothetical protein
LRFVVSLREPAEFKIEALPGEQTFTAGSDLLEEDARLLGCQEIHQGALEIGHAARRELSALAPLSCCERLLGRCREHAKVRTGSVAVDAFANVAEDALGLCGGDEIEFVDHKEKLLDVAADLGQELDLRLAQWGVEAGHEDHGVGLRQKRLGRRCVGGDRRSDPGRVDEREAKSQDLRWHFHERGGDAQLLPLPARLSDESDEFVEGPFERKRASGQLDKRARLAAVADRGDHRRHRQRSCRQVRTAENRVHQGALATAELADNRKLERVFGELGEEPPSP